MSSTMRPSPTSSSAAATSCVSATPGKYGYVPPGACNSYYDFSPSFALAIAFSVLFGSVTLLHTFQAVRYKKGFCWVMIMGGIWETVSFIGRALGAHDQQSSTYATISQLLLLLSPLWVNAFAYMVLGRMIYYYLPEKKIYGIKAASLAKYFVCADIFSFIIQGVGGSMTSSVTDTSIVMTGIHIYMGGIGAQELFILTFTALVITFHRRMIAVRQQGRETAGRTGWLRLTITLYLVLALITARIVYRLIEYARGTTASNPLPFHEVYLYVLDAAPMLIAIFIFNVSHPGHKLVGPDSSFPHLSRKQKKALKAEKKERKAAEKEARKGTGKGQWWPIGNRKEASLPYTELEVQYATPKGR
ncbi:MAG: hypothetical protein M4579_001567 [Chaenotheca gracillima]|nr:MAG: hypothetical protein M4579_001567 [Chaenotheca gracillima]